jgi:hypothetical protein
MYPCIIEGVVTPSSHRLRKITEIVQTICTPFRPFVTSALILGTLYRGHPGTRPVVETNRSLLSADNRDRWARNALRNPQTPLAIALRLDSGPRGRLS